MEAHIATVMESKITPTKRSCRSKLICRICGDVARGINFDVLTCMSCKAFFRRNALSPTERLRCSCRNFCEITKETRNRCPSCRLRKCRAFGMNPLLIRSVDPCEAGPTRFQQLIMAKQKQIQLSMPRPLGLLQNDRSSLSTDQWDLLSNIIRSYDEQNLIIRVKYSLMEKCSLPPKLRSKCDDTMNVLIQNITAIQPCIKHSHHFQHLSNHACRALILHNAYFTGSISAVFVARETDSFNNMTFMAACSLVYGYDFMMNCARDNERLEKNGNLIKLMIFVIIFSSNCSIVAFNEQEDIDIMSSTIELIHIQDVYVTVLWKYLVYLYGDVQAAIRFSSLVKSVLDMLQRAKQLAENLTHDTLINRIVMQMERSLVKRD